MSSVWAKLAGTQVGSFFLGLTGVLLKNSSGNLAVRNHADNADAEVTASKVNISGDRLVINSDGNSAGANWKYNIDRPASGMTADVTLVLPVDDGSPSQVLQTDGNGVLSWATINTNASITTDTTSFAFGSGATVAAFTLPANAVVEKTTVIVDTAFNGTPTLSVGVNGGSASKYVASTDVDLTVVGRYEIPYTDLSVGVTEAIQIAYSAGGASAGAGRMIMHYSVPA